MMRPCRVPLATLVLLLSLCLLPMLGQTHSVQSPDRELNFTLSVDEQGALSYAVSFRRQPVLVPSPMGLDFENQALLGGNVQLGSVNRGQESETYEMPHGKSNPIGNQYNWLRVDLEEPGPLQRRLTIEARAYDDGVAFRYVLPEQPALRAFRLTGENTAFFTSKDATAYPMILPHAQTSQESEYDIRPLTSLTPGALIGVPFLMDIPGVAWVAITEAHLRDYSGMLLTPRSERRSFGRVPGVSVKLSRRFDDPEVAVTGSAPHASPWRVVMVAEDPGRLIESNLIINLNPPSAIQDTSWIQAGKSAWNWWSDDIVDKQPFAGGMNTATMKYYVDFAAEAGLEFFLIDAGWCGPHDALAADITKPIPEVDLPEILRYAKGKGVKIWLWLNWAWVDKQLDVAFPLYEKWGVAGVKVDYMNREDQWMVDFYHRVVEKAAQHQLMVDLHGAYKPTGIRRTFPNLMTREGVLGMEYSKWSARSNPEHNVTIPYTRMLAGPIDFTPGGFDNVTREQFESRMHNPMVMGTRAHHLAMYVVYESPAQMVSDHPGAYRDQPAFDFIRAVPATWDETHFVNGKVADYITLARRRGREWFIGSMTDWTARDLEIPLDFLGQGEFIADVYADAPEASTDPKRVAIERSKPVNRSTLLKAHLASGGGYTVHIRPRP